MPHYSNNQRAEIGDFVRGKGYNIKDESGNPKEIVGLVLGITGGPECNLKVACNFRLVDKDKFRTSAARGMIRNVLAADDTINKSYDSDCLLVYGSFGNWYEFEIEYGEAKNFQPV